MNKQDVKSEEWVDLLNMNAEVYNAVMKKQDERSADSVD